MSGGYIVCQNGSMFAEPVGFRTTMHHYRRPPNTSRHRPDDRRYVPVPRSQVSNYPRSSHHQQRSASFGGRLSPATHHQHPAGDYSDFQYRQQYQQVHLQQHKVLAMWHTNEHQFPGILRLHEEIIAFYKDIRPLPEERQMRDDVVRRVTDAIKNRWPGTQVEVFGSMRTGLYLPTSDIDLVVFHGFDRTPFSDIRDELISRGICTNQTIKVLESASVPIIKLTDQLTQVKVDIGFNIRNSQRSADLVQAYMHQYPALPYLVIVLKQFLYQHELNEVYSGGISSYSLVLLTISFLQSRSYTGRMALSANYGVLLLEFFQLYSRLFQFQRVVVSVTRAGGCHVKPWIDNVHQPSLSIEDPLCSENDVARGSYNVSRVQAAFAGALRQLNEEIYRPIYVCPSPKGMLSSIVRVPAEIERYRYWVQQRFPVISPCSASNVSLSPCHGPFELSSSSGISSASPEPQASVSCCDSVETSDEESDDDHQAADSTQTCTAICNTRDYVDVHNSRAEVFNSIDSHTHVEVSTPILSLPTPSSSPPQVRVVTGSFETQASDPSASDVVDGSLCSSVLLDDVVRQHDRTYEKITNPLDVGESAFRVKAGVAKGILSDNFCDAFETHVANIDLTMQLFSSMAVQTEYKTNPADEINAGIHDLRGGVGDKSAALCHADNDASVGGSCFEAQECEQNSAGVQSARNVLQILSSNSVLQSSMHCDRETHPARCDTGKTQSSVSPCRPPSSNPKGDNSDGMMGKSCGRKPENNQVSVSKLQDVRFLGVSPGEKLAPKLMRPGAAQSFSSIEPVIMVNYDHIS